MTDISGWQPLRYAADVAPRPTLHGAPLMAPSVGTGVRLNAADMLAVDGVLAVFDAAADDYPSWSGVPHGGRPERRIITDEPRSAGEVVGAVVADSPAALAAALALAQIEIITPATESVELLPGPSYGDDKARVAAAIEAAPYRRTDTMRIGSGPNGAIELPAASAAWVDGTLRVTATSQTPQPTATTLAALFGLPRDRVELTPVPLGGGFGGKEEVILEPLAALASRHLGGRRVLIRFTRSQAMTLYRRHDATVTVTTGFSGDGMLLARWIDAEFGCGAHLGHAEHIARSGVRVPKYLYGMGAAGGESTLRIDATPVRGPFRGYGSPQVHAVCEHQVDLIAAGLDIDPVAIRRRNLTAAIGSDTESGSLVSRLLTCLDAVDKQISESGMDRRRVGISLGANISSASGPGEEDSAQVRVTATGGRITVDTGMVDMGQGILRAARTVAARELRCAEHLITVASPPTSLVPTDRGTFASRGSYVFLGAVALACRQLLADSPAWRERQHATTTATFSAPDDAMAACAQAVELAPGEFGLGFEVTGVVSVHDAGAVVDRSRAELQVIGGVLQGLGWALHESTDPPDHTMLRAGLPTWHDAPPTTVHFIDSLNPNSPIGARGLGEIPTVPTLAAVANAAYQLSGQPCTQLPLDPLHPSACSRAAHPDTLTGYRKREHGR